MGIAMEIVPCRYLLVNREHVPREPTPPPQTTIAQIVIRVTWGVLGPTIAILIGCAFNVIGYTPPAFRMAWWFFIAAAVLMVFAICLTGVLATAPFLMRVAMVSVVIFASGCLLSVALMWVAWRESEFALRVKTKPSDTQATVTETPPAPLSQEETTTVRATPSTTVTDARAEINAPDGTELGSRRNPLTIAPKKLTEPFDSHTNIEANAIVRRYLGKWLKVKGPVHNVAEFRDEVSVYLFVPEGRTTEAMVALRFRLDSPSASAVRVLHPPEQITVVGKIDRIDGRIVMLEDCELIEP